MAARIAVPKEANTGEVIEIKTLIQHVMETGHRRDNAGNMVPRKILNRFTCTYNGEEVFRADLGTGISANPLIAFHTVATASGDLVFAWTDDDGTVLTEKAQIVVT